MAMYFGMISQIDDAVGRVLDALDRLGQADNTIVVYTTDHGDLCGGHGMLDKHMVMYEDIMHVPFILRYPGKVKAGTKAGGFCYTMDFASTLCDLLDINYPGNDGTSLVPILNGEIPDSWRSDVLCTYNGMQFGLYTQRMIRDIRYKYVWIRKNSCNTAPKGTILNNLRGPHRHVQNIRNHGRSAYGKRIINRPEKNIQLFPHHIHQLVQQAACSKN
jgi:arylsulfatase A-like enzyme